MNDNPRTVLTARRRGRPRDATKDDAVQAAVRELLIEVGYRGATIAHVARRAGVGAPTIYRRWPTQAALVETVFEYHDEKPTSPDESFEALIRHLVEGSFRIFADPATRRAVPGLLVEYQRDPASYQALVARLELPERDRLRLAHAKAVAAGQASPQPAADELLDMIIGTTLFVGLVRGESSADAIERVASMILAAAST